ncbi:uncharacterized protein C11orf86 homolog isoform X2 [Lepus europaeus]|uniref:uncharacterized protein C11orf86 homolog isoform X2 n=1 Tax=Lepus europaeus TaxID=9983 RepID=UPI002B471317|nr:uncharacterized protein C11orf86 homolog isoform X2 [Lepus europaeus]
MCWNRTRAGDFPPGGWRHEFIPEGRTVPAAFGAMGTGLRSQSLRGPRPSYGKLQDPRGRPLEGRPRRALSLRQERDKPRAQGPEGDTEGLNVPAQEWLPGALGDTEQLIQERRGSGGRWLRHCGQVKRRWDSLVASFPSVTLSRSASPEPPLGTAS